MTQNEEQTTHIIPDIKDKKHPIQNKELEMYNDKYRIFISRLYCHTRGLRHQLPKSEWSKVVLSWEECVCVSGSEFDAAQSPDSNTVTA